MPAPGCTPRKDGSGEAAGVSGMDLLGKARAGVWRPAGTALAAGTGAGRARFEPDRADVYRRPFRGFSLHCTVQSRLCQSAFGFPFARRIEAVKRVHHRSGAMRTTRQQAASQGAGQLPRLPGTRAGDCAPESGAGTGEDRLGYLSWRSEVSGDDSVTQSMELRA